MEKLLAISVSKTHTLVLDSKGKVSAWGFNEMGQLGVGDTEPHEKIVEIKTLKDIAAIVSGHSFSLALDNKGEVYIWGQDLNFTDISKYGLSLYIKTPQKISSLSGVTQIAINNLTAYALPEGGWPCGWGWCDSAGALGARRRNPSSIPVQILGPPPLEFLTTGETHALGLDKDGKIWTWGLNDFGQRGLTGFNYTTNPTLLNLPFSCSAIATGQNHNLTLSKDGDVFAWGSNIYGESGLAIGTQAGGIFTPTIVNGLPKIISIATGNYSSFAKSENSDIWSWGGDIGPVPKIISLSSQMESLVFSKGSPRIPSLKACEKLIRLLISDQIRL